MERQQHHAVGLQYKQINSQACLNQSSGDRSFLSLHWIIYSADLHDITRAARGSVAYPHLGPARLLVVVSICDRRAANKIVCGLFVRPFCAASGGDSDPIRDCVVRSGNRVTWDLTRYHKVTCSLRPVVVRQFVVQPIVLIGNRMDSRSAECGLRCTIVFLELRPFVSPCLAVTYSVLPTEPTQLGRVRTKDRQSVPWLGRRSDHVCNRSIDGWSNATRSAT
jgi:hypothetical protein